MSTTDYDAPRRSTVDLEEDSLEELKSRLAEMEKAASLIGQAMLRP